MDLVARILDRARGNNVRVVLPDGSDARVLGAACSLRDQGIARPIVLGRTTQLNEIADQAQWSPHDLEILDPHESPRIETYAAAYARRRGVAPHIARRLVRKPLIFGGMMLAEGDADAMVAGAVNATATVIQSAAVSVGYAPGINTPSSFFLMILPALGDRQQVPLVFADCAVNVQPTAEQLADIALTTQATAARLLDEPPRVALLSFSTTGSGTHADAQKVRDALELIHQRDPTACIDGEFQADTALAAQVAVRKLKRASTVAGTANVLIFPDLDAGNIGYKLTQYLAGAQAIGPVLQGFAKPLSDLSRGATVADIVTTAAICAAQAKPADPTSEDR